MSYVGRIVGSFTLEKLVQAATCVVMVGTGTGLAPFVSMLKQVHHDSVRSGRDHRVYTLLHTNRTVAELGYHQTLSEIQAARSFDFLYLPTVSRPTARDLADPTIGVGRATNVLRSIYELPMTEEDRIAKPGRKYKAIGAHCTSSRTRAELRVACAPSAKVAHGSNESLRPGRNLRR